MALLAPAPKQRFTSTGAVWTTFIQNCFVFALLWWPTPIVLGQELQAPEYKVKAAFLYNFTKLVEWPTNTFASETTPLIIGVLGKDPFGKDLDDLVAGRTAKNRPVQIVRFTSVEQITNCQVLYVSESERRKLDAIFDALRGQPILTVSDLRGFETRGMITLVKSNANINLRINLDATKQARLQLSSRLIRLDRTLRPTEAESPAPPPQRTD